MTNEEVQKLRAAFADRAMYLALLYRSFCEVLPPEQAEAQARKAIYEYGRLKGAADTQRMDPESWMDHHAAGGARLFETEIVRLPDRTEMHMTTCPLLDGFRQAGCTPEEMDLLCDIAMEVDRGRADYHGIPWQITHRLGKGDTHCCLVLNKS